MSTDDTGGTALPLTPDTVNAIVNALGAVVFATVRRLPQAERAGFASDLQRLAESQERAGETLTGTLLRDLQRAAQSAAN